MDPGAGLVSLALHITYQTPAVHLCAFLVLQLALVLLPIAAASWFWSLAWSTAYPVYHTRGFSRVSREGSGAWQGELHALHCTHKTSAVHFLQFLMLQLVLLPLLRANRF